jgi:pimeloyl-ACP methyl ester carboxylesterase
MKRMRATIALFTVALFAAAASAVYGADRPALQVQSCLEGKSKVAAECGSLRVFENRSGKRGRTIDVHFILLKAAHPSGHVIYVNLGGPGSELGAVPAIADGLFFKELTALRDRYDVLFVDERGFGLSNSLRCNLVPLRQPEVYFRQLWPDKLLTDCRNRLAQRADLARYNTSNAVDDLDDLRQALGYRRIIFDVASYGTFTAFVYMRRHPGTVESAVLSGVAPPGIVNQAREFANGARMGLEGIAADCEHDAKCRANFPHFREHFYALVHEMDRGPIPVHVKNGVTKRVQTVSLSKEVFADAIRHALYEPDSAALVPFVIERAYAHDTLPLGTVIDVITRGFAAGIDAGAFLSYTCAEVMPFTDKPADVRYAQTTSWYGDGRDLAQQAACRIWNVPAMPASFDQPVRSEAPVLMVSGTLDSATPSYEGKEELRYLPNGRQMLVRNAPHDTESPCVDKTIEAFIRTDSAAGLNLDSCSGSFKRPPFATSLPKLP